MVPKPSYEPWTDERIQKIAKEIFIFLAISVAVAAVCAFTMTPPGMAIGGLVITAFAMKILLSVNIGLSAASAYSYFSGSLKNEGIKILLPPQKIQVLEVDLFKGSLFSEINDIYDKFFKKETLRKSVLAYLCEYKNFSDLSLKEAEKRVKEKNPSAFSIEELQDFFKKVKEINPDLAIAQNTVSKKEETSFWGFLTGFIGSKPTKEKVDTTETQRIKEMLFLLLDENLFDLFLQKNNSLHLAQIQLDFERGFSYEIEGESFTLKNSSFPCLKKKLEELDLTLEKRSVLLSQLHHGAFAVARERLIQEKEIDYLESSHVFPEFTITKKGDVTVRFQRNLLSLTAYREVDRRKELRGYDFLYLERNQKSIADLGLYEMRLETKPGSNFQSISYKSIVPNLDALEFTQPFFWSPVPPLF